MDYSKSSLISLLVATGILILLTIAVEYTIFIFTLGAVQQPMSLLGLMGVSAVQLFMLVIGIGIGIMYSAILSGELRN